MSRALAAIAVVMALLIAAGLGGGAAAKEAQPVGADPAIERRAMDLAQQLRCLVCQNQTIADSNADLANDLRQKIRQLLAQGASDDQVRDYMTARYGDFVLYRPPLRPVTLLLWFGPVVLLGGGLAALFIVLRRRALLLDDADPGDDDERRALELLAQDEEGRV
jgi:cytochrome c-type biogenesis protein CcmH